MAGPDDTRRPDAPGLPSAEATIVTPPAARDGANDATAQLRPAAAVEPREAATVSPGARGRRARKRRPTRQPLDFTATTRVGRFELIRELAHGGMGQVFLARDPLLGRKVAIKFLLRDDPRFVARFLVEARATARCTHENIVTIFEVGEHEGLPYMVLEYLEGQTLSEVLGARPSARQLVELLVPVARALERAHAHGIVHRDLKPSNIFVTDRGVVKVLDFGVARLFDDERAATSVDDAEGLDDDHGDGSTGGRGRPASDAAGQPALTAGYVGTLPYMSPEQWGADAVDAVSDLWPFGIMLWRGLVGAHPVGSMEEEVLRAACSDLATPLPSIGDRDPTLAPALIAIVDRCLAKRKADRYGSAGALAADLDAFLRPAGARGAAEASPYRGLAPFGEDDAARFFGRAAEIRAALAQLEASPLLAVVGPSGVGKSSFVHAGLVPALRATGAWQVHRLRPGHDPLARLAGVVGLGPTTGAPALARRLIDEPGVFGAQVRQAADAAATRVLIVVDQLEELFTLGAPVADREAFLAALLAAADDPSAPIRVVASMRADFLDRFATHKAFLAELRRGLSFLAAPDRGNLREALVRPAELAGYGFEDGLADDMVAATTGPGALPLLSFAAAQLWEARDRDRKLLTRSAYDALGGVAGAFTRHADGVVAATPAASQPLLRAILIRLVTADGTRAIADRAELTSLTAQPADAEAILDQLARGRLIAIHTDPDHGAAVELVHEMLIDAWPLLRRWLDEGQAARGFLDDLRAAARQWDGHGRTADRTWRGATARDALAQAERHVLGLTVVERAFLAAAAGQLAAERRRKVASVASIAGMIALAFAGGAVALVRINAARDDAEGARGRAEAEAETARVTTGFLVDLFKVADPSESLGDKLTVRELLDKGATRITAELAAQPAVQATLLDTIGVAYTGLGLFPQAIGLLDQAVAARRRLFGAIHPLTALALRHRGYALSLAARYPEAEVDLWTALATYRSAGPGARADVAATLVDLSETLTRLGRNDEEYRLAREALDLRTALHPEDHVDVAESLEDVGLALDALGRTAEGLPLMVRAVAIRRRLQGPAHPLLGEAIANLANFYRNLSRNAEAQVADEEAVAMLRKLRGDQHPEVAMAMSNLGFDYEVDHRYAEAERAYRGGLEILRASNPDSPNLAAMLDSLGYVLILQHQPEAGIALLREAMTRRERQFGPEHQDVAYSAAGLGHMLLAQGKVDEAAPLIARALALRTKLDGPEHPGTAGAMTLQARVLVARGRFEEARALAAAARAILVKSLPPDHWKVALAATVEGAALVRLGRYAEAEPLLVASYPRLKDAPIPTVYDDCRQQLVALYTALGRPEQAAAYVAAPSTTVAAPPP